MYKLLLCWRYLRTRYIALASIISVTLGVATLIVVNAVMAGGKEKLLDTLRNFHSDLELEVRSMEGAPDAEAHMARLRRAAGDQIAGMSPTVRVPAMLGYHIGQQYHSQQVMVVGVDEATYASVSGFGDYLQHPENRKQLSFDLREGGYDTIDHQAKNAKGIKPRPQMENAGWKHRRALYATQAASQAASQLPAPESAAPPAASGGPTGDMFAASSAIAPVDSNPANEQQVGCVLGIRLASYRKPDGADMFVQLPGNDVEITYPSAGRPPKPLSAKFTIVDFYESKMDYDMNFVLAPLERLQQMRGMIDPATGAANFTAIQIRLKPGADLNEVRDRIRGAFPEQFYVVSTWLDKQGPLVQAIQIETMVLNLLLFLIIAVSGFGILAIFFMIVVEKTCDIGILKSLGASSGGVMSVFLSYGLLLGIVGSGAGVFGGLTIVEYINEIAEGIGAIFGMNLFDPTVYPFAKIPTIVDPVTIAVITVSSIGIAVLASIFPAWRAAAMNPVAALRWG